jgi:DNA-directed RNA polymerase specialized sigma24 family protein
MPEQPDPASLLEKHRGWIERVAFRICHRDGVMGEDAEDFLSYALERLVEDDYAALRRFRGLITTHLTVVVSMLYLDWRVSHWRKRRRRMRAAPREAVPQAPMPRDQSWFHHPEVQKRVAEAEADFREGRYTRTATPEEAQAYLDSLKQS